MEAQLAVLPKSPLGKAIGYTLDNWKELTVYTTDGRIPIGAEGHEPPVPIRWIEPSA